MLTLALSQHFTFLSKCNSISLAKTLSSSYLWIWNNAFYNRFFFFFFLHLVICRCTFTNRAWSVCMYMYLCMAYLVSPKYMTVAGQMKGFTVYYCLLSLSLSWIVHLGWVGLLQLCKKDWFLNLSDYFQLNLENTIMLRHQQVASGYQ